MQSKASRPAFWLNAKVRITDLLVLELKEPVGPLLTDTL